eukprot:gene20562-22584_t
MKGLVAKGRQVNIGTGTVLACPLCNKKDNGLPGQELTVLLEKELKNGAFSCIGLLTAIRFMDVNNSCMNLIADENQSSYDFVVLGKADTYQLPQEQKIYKGVEDMLTSNMKFNKTCKHLTALCLLSLSFIVANVASKSTNINSQSSTDPKKESNLFEVLVLANKFSNDLENNGNVKRFNLTEINEVKLNILKEAIWYKDAENKRKDKTVLERDIEKKMEHGLLVLKLVQTILSSFSKTMGISLLVDNSEFGETTTVLTVQRLMKENQVLSIFQLENNGANLEDVLSKVAAQKSDVFILDCFGSLAANSLKKAAMMGLVGELSGISWFLTQRAMVSLKLSWTLPEGEIYGIDRLQPSHSSRHLSRKFSNHGNRTDQNATAIFKLRPKPDSDEGKTWEEIDLSVPQERQNYVTRKLPKLRVAFANPIEPLLSVVDLPKTNDKSDAHAQCGLEGRFGYRHLNSSSSELVPICVYGLNVDVLNYLEKNCEFTSEIRIVKDGLYGSYNEAGNNFSGIVGAIFENKADIGVDLSANVIRKEFIEFTTPYRSMSFGIAYIHRHAYGHASLFGPFSLHLWLALLGSFLAIALFIWGVENISNNAKNRRDHTQPSSPEHKDKMTKKFTILHSISGTIGTLFSGEIISERPKSFASRSVLVIMSIVSIIIVTTYSANLIAFLVVLDETPLVRGLTDPKLINENSKLKVGVLAGTSEATFLRQHPDKRIRKLYSRTIQFASFEVGINELRNSKIDALFSIYEDLQLISSKDRSCNMKAIDLTTENDAKRAWDLTAAPRRDKQCEEAMVGKRNPSFNDPLSTEERKPLSQKLDIPTSYLTPFPYLANEDLEEPPPKVSAPVARILENSRPKIVNGVFFKPRYNGRQLAKLRKQYISEGYYWPEKPMRDRTLDRTPAGTKREREREERKMRIAEAMENMPKIVAAYRQKIYALREKRRQDKEKNKLKIAKIHALGLHPNDPKAKKILHEGTSLEKSKGGKEKPKKKFQKKDK